MKLYSSAYHVWPASMKQAAIGENANVVLTAKG
jgi:hypothetical protein